jgi:hypothetical protein
LTLTKNLWQYNLVAELIYLFPGTNEFFVSSIWPDSVLFGWNWMRKWSTHGNIQFGLPQFHSSSFVAQYVKPSTRLTVIPFNANERPFDENG